MGAGISGLTEEQLRDWLQAVRRIASLDETAALREVDTLAFGRNSLRLGSTSSIQPESGRLTPSTSDSPPTPPKTKRSGRKPPPLQKS
jgi:hypothetical protein